MPTKTVTDEDSPTSARMKARILRAVVDVVADHGLSATTLARVADTAGVSQGVLVFHFKSKAGLLNATCRHLTEDYVALWQPILAEADPAQRVIGLVGADFHDSICAPAQLALWFAFWGESAAQPLYDDICRAEEERRAAAMRQACRDLAQQIAIPDPDMLATAIDGFTDGLWLQMHLQQGALSPDQARDMALSHLAMLVPALAERM
ncbi:TetR family transcriptional regulator C-terminal domain-containing protein [uncultured Shimia sp.]|uniref:TetR/AcrR family transcriptional regulator n=1 Tax=uncultured Shimia sp. TaxID=573152 RepID=UPI0026173321|nr:TetR family transcriptional regulator C-terminal domain-containing protein [uncultured Shimia sp.]